MSEAERIGLAAIRCRGQIFTGASHAEAFMVLLATFPDVADDELPAQECGGFTTNLRPYVDRTEALQIAARSGQITADHTPEDNKLRSQHILKTAPHY